MKADYEPWWQFEGWESTIVSTFLCETEKEFQERLDETLVDFRQKFEHEASKEDRYYAFWTEEEREYCDACEDDIQIFHGIIVNHLMDNKI